MEQTQELAKDWIKFEKDTEIFDGEKFVRARYFRNITHGDTSTYAMINDDGTSWTARDCFSAV